MSSAELTATEIRVLCHMGDGDSVKTTVAATGHSFESVKSHRRRMFRKLGAKNGPHAVAIAFRQGLIDRQSGDDSHGTLDPVAGSQDRESNDGDMRVPKLFTIGYEGRTPDGLISRLREAKVDHVVDVRELPLSRRQGFSKASLAAALESAGIRYEHVRALGNPKPYRERYKGGDVEGGARAYRAHLHNGSHPALVDLADAVDGSNICLLCVEDTHDRCHRAVIAGAIAERLPRVAIVHL